MSKITRDWEAIKAILNSAENCILISDIHQLTSLEYDRISTILQEHNDEIRSTSHEGKNYYSLK